MPEEEVGEKSNEEEGPGSESFVRPPSKTSSMSMARDSPGPAPSE